MEQALQQHQNGAQLVFVSLSVNANWWAQTQRVWESAASGTVVIITGGRGDIKVRFERRRQCCARFTYTSFQELVRLQSAGADVEQLKQEALRVRRTPCWIRAK